jgi:uncharacterized protein YndB with AHSA1/START domain
MSKELKYAHIVQEHVVNAPRAQVFKALTEEANAWWCHTANENSKAVHMEPKIGGRFYEDFGNGGGFLYATVTWLKPGEEIELSGAMGFDGPSTGVFSFTLEERGKSTLIKLEHKFFGPLSNETEGMYQEGWKELLAGTFKDFVEKGTRLR